MAACDMLIAFDNEHLKKYKLSMWGNKQTTEHKQLLSQDNHMMGCGNQCLDWLKAKYAQCPLSFCNPRQLAVVAIFSPEKNPDQIFLLEFLASSSMVGGWWPASTWGEYRSPVTSFNIQLCVSCPTIPTLQPMSGGSWCWWVSQNYMGAAELTIKTIRTPSEKSR